MRALALKNLDLILRRRPGASVRAYMSFQCLAAILIVQVGFIGQLASSPQSFAIAPDQGLSRVASRFHGDYDPFHKLVAFFAAHGDFIVSRTKVASEIPRVIKCSSMCSEGRTLLAEYIKATKEHARATKYLASLAGKTTQSVFSEALATSEAARKACERARLTFRAHKAEHEC
jgi:hypothetical protein